MEIRSNAALPDSRVPAMRPSNESYTAFPLSHMQGVILTAEQLAEDQAPYNESFAWRLRGNVDEQWFRERLAILVARHEALRTAITWVGGKWQQRILARAEVDWQYVDAKAWQVGQIEEFLAVEADRKFNLLEGPLVRGRLIRRSADTAFFLLTIHHLAVDTQSFATMFDNIRAPSSPSSKYSYRDFVRHEAGCLSVPRSERSTVSRSPPQFAGEQWRESLGRERTRLLHKVSRELGVTRFSFLLAALASLKGLREDQREVSIACPLDKRPGTEFRDVVGCFVNVTELKLAVFPTATVDEMVRSGHQAIGSALHSHSSFQATTADLFFGWESAVRGQEELLALFSAHEDAQPIIVGGLAWSPLAIPNRPAKFNLSLTVHDLPEEAILTWGFSTARFQTAAVRIFATEFICLLDGFLTRTSTEIGKLITKQQSEGSMALTDRRRSSGSAIHHAFEQWARTDSQRRAILTSSIELTYDDLERRANGLARRLATEGVRHGQIVGILLERGPDQVVAVLATWKVGAAYVPMSPQDPPARIDMIVRDVEPCVVITDKGHRDKVKTNTLLIDDAPTPTQGPFVPSSFAQEDSLAYVIYTSGSTGRPKGVMVEHGSVIRCLKAMEQSPGLSRDDILAGGAELSFDISVVQMFLPLSIGATFAIVDRETGRDGHLLGRFLRASNATVMQATPSHWRLLINSGWQGQTGLRAWSGGEVLAPTLAKELARRCDEVWNLYGPTETTIYATSHRVRTIDESIPIGVPFDHIHFSVLGEDRNPVPADETGELYLGGECLARGYWRDPALTADRFIYLRNSNERFYRTGDLVRLDADGRLIYRGRNDRQVKIRGHRVELGELERVLEELVGVDHAIVTAEIRGEDHTILRALVIAADPAVTSERCLLHARESLPSYMIPSAFDVVRDVKRLPNGKVDRAALPPTIPTSLGEWESRVLSMWRQVLRRDSLDGDANFFDLGGDSMLVVELANQIEKALHVTCSAKDLYLYPTAASLAAHLSGRTSQMPNLEEAQRRAALRRRLLRDRGGSQ